ncbi:MAG: hypothetical protein ACRD6N_10135 [Pyrinomonadaceae bacterium]
MKLIVQSFKWSFLRALVVLLTATLMPVETLSQVANQPSARHIIICVDGVGISTINKMRADGHFKMFHSPSRMISPFPSLTNAAISKILEPAGAKMTDGYEDNFFDTEANQMRGGILDRFRGGRFIRGTFRELFDYHPSAIKSGLGYAAPPISTYLESLSDVIRLRQKARNSRQPVFFAYTGAPDSLAHLGGETLLRSFLKRLDESVEDLVRDSEVPVVVTIFSDHGNHFRKYRRVSLKTPLKRAGFKIEKQIKRDQSVVLPQFGLVGSAVLFTNEKNEERLATVLAAVEGVDFTTYERDGIVYVASKDGEATIEKREDQYRYLTTKGDPLGLLPITHQLAAWQSQGEHPGLLPDAPQLTAEEGNGPDGFISDASWFAATRDTARPDAIRRIFEGATQGVVNRANVIINFKDGYYTGSSLLDLLTILQATHGNIGQEQSYGFVMSTRQELPAYIRAGDLWKTLGSPQLRRSQKNPGL